MPSQAEQLLANQAKELAGIILGSPTVASSAPSLPQGSQGLQILQGVIVSFPDYGYVDVQIAGSDFTIPRLRYMEGYQPRIGDVVWILRKGRDTMILGRLKNVTQQTLELDVPTVIGDGSAPGFASGAFIAATSGGTKLQYYVDPDGICHMSGKFIANTGASGTIFTLPVEARPYQFCQFPCSRPGSTADMPRITVNTNGTVQLPTTITAGSTISVTHICFPTVQFNLARLTPLGLGNGMNHHAIASPTVYAPSAFVRDDGWVLLTGWTHIVGSVVDSVGGGGVVVELGDIAPLQSCISKAMYQDGSGNYFPQFSRLVTMGSTLVIPGTPVTGDFFCLDGVNFFTSERENDWLNFGTDIPFFNNGGEIWQPMPDYAPPGLIKDKYGVVRGRGVIQPNSAGFDSANYITKLIPYSHTPYVWFADLQPPPYPTGAHSPTFNGHQINVYGATLSPATSGVKRVIAGTSVTTSDEHYPWAGTLFPDNTYTWDTGSYISLQGVSWRTDWNSDYGYV
jgi:hypothetical protein